jgi:hypothetical protein
MPHGTAHGRARELRCLVVSETTPADELPAATASDPWPSDGADES